MFASRIKGREINPAYFLTTSMIDRKINSFNSRVHTITTYILSTIYIS